MPSTVQIYNQAISDFKSLQTIIADKQAKIGADSKADSFAELGDDISSVQGFKLSIERSDRYINSIKDAQRKNDTQYQAIQQILEIASQFKQNLTIESTTTSGAVNNLSQQANSSLDNIRGALNLRDGANFVFAGSKTNQQPVSDLKLSNNIVDSTPLANYYEGDNFKAAVDVSASLQVEYGFNAADPAFVNLIGAINLAKNAEAQGTNNYQQAGDLFEQAYDQLLALQAKIGDNAKVFENNLDFQDKAKSIFEAKYAEVNEPNIVQLTIESTQAQTTLQASFQIFSKISQLSLINFL
jgi:flagellar hook-associated protein 3 FlgL